MDIELARTLLGRDKVILAKVEEPFRRGYSLTRPLPTERRTASGVSWPQLELSHASSLHGLGRCRRTSIARPHLEREV